MKLLTLAMMVGSAAGLCAEACSGHGVCGQHDKCTCYDNFQGVDCSERTCPFTIAWADVGSHSYAECGNKGECDRGSGVCKCFDGYTGKGCQRLSCPDDCNGHGTCERFGDVQSSSYTGWDADKIMVCQCDPGYSGPGCGSRMCPVGDDIMTPYTANQQHDVQKISIDGDTAAPTGDFVLTFKDWRGQKWYTWAIELDTASAIGVEEALEALPNHAIPDVNVTKTVTGNVVDWKVTFVSARNTGAQGGKLGVETAGCTLSGCQPHYDGTTADGTVTTDTAGSTEAAVCSNRGSCVGETGTCECNSGFYGEACELQTVIL